MLFQLFAQRELRVALLLLGLAIVTASVLLISAASQTVAVEVNQDLGHYWRTTYDILVRPSGSRSPIEARYGLVEANYLSGIWGGITFDQYEAIKTIPDIEVAAPVAALVNMRGALINPLAHLRDHDSPFQAIFVPHEPGLYAIERTIEIDMGIDVHYEEHITYVYNDPAEERGALADGIQINPTGSMYAGIRAPSLLLGAIDPVQEAALIGLDQAIVEGEYLTGNEPLNVGVYVLEGPPRPQVDDVPILINATPYDYFAQYNRIVRVLLPDYVSSLADILEQGGPAYLNQLPTETIAEQQLDSEVLYAHYIERLSKNERELPAFITFEPRTRTYREVRAPFPYPYLVLEARLETERAEFPAIFTMQARGVYDIERIPRPADVHRVPLETYFPPVATLLYDDTGASVEPKTFRPTSITEHYIPIPPLLLTTMEAARALRGEDAISAIRVRVAGIDRLTAANQRKIETIAGEIVRLTGLDVDIMVGSSPTRVLVHVPGVGYVEEQWIQKNVTATYQERVQTGHLILLAALLGIGGLFVLDLAWADVVARRRTIALQKALGWRSSTVFGLVLGRLLLVGLLATTLGALLAWGLARLSGWEPLPLSLLAGVPLLVITISLLGGLYPAWLAARVPPIVGLQHGNIQPATGTSSGRSFFPLPSALFLLAWRGLARRWSRSVLGGLTAALSAALLVLMLGVTVDRQGAMSGTLLGEFILVRIEGYHYAIAGIGFGLAALSLANSLLAGVLERRREIGVLKAVGWHTATVARLFLLEGVWLGLLGGLAGAILGLAIFAGLYETVPSSLGWIGLAGVLTPVVVGALAALYPARVAAHIPPAEAVRYE
jgi:hypothetical protein